MTSCTFFSLNLSPYKSQDYMTIIRHVCVYMCLHVHKCMYLCKPQYLYFDDHMFKDCYYLFAEGYSPDSLPHCRLPAATMKSHKCKPLRLATIMNHSCCRSKPIDDVCSRYPIVKYVEVLGWVINLCYDCM